MRAAKIIAVLALLTGCTSTSTELEIESSDVPEVVMTSFKNKYPAATEVEWEAEKEDGKLYFEAEFKLDGKEIEAHFRPDGTFTEMEDD